MGFELSGVIKCVLYNKDRTVDYVFDDAKLDEVIAPFENEADTEKIKIRRCFCQAQRILKSLLSPPILAKMLYIC